MADISKIKMPNNTSYDLKDAAARESIAALPTDIQINGTSIVNNGIANIPLASGTNLGVIKVDNNGTYGTMLYDGELRILPASGTNVKEGVDTRRPIVPGNQHKVVFYGLTKAAGVDMGASNNEVGQYTDNAKGAIQNMLGITSLFANEEHSTATAAHSVNSLFMMNGKLHRATSAITIGDAVVVGTNCEIVKANDVFVKNTDMPVEYGTGIGSLQTKSFTYNKNVFSSTASGVGATAIGISTQASGVTSHSEGDSTIASGYGSHAEGILTTASNAAAHAEGANTIANGPYAHAEGVQGTASGSGSHAEGFETTASNTGAHAEGFGSVASGYGSHAEGFSSVAAGRASHVEGYLTIASGQSTHVIGQYNVDLNAGTAADVKGTYVEMIGNGTADNARSNAYALDWGGNGYYNGYLYVGCNADSTNGTRLPHDIQINGTSIVNNGVANIPLASTSDLGLVKIPAGNDQGIGIIVNGDSNGNTISTGELTLIMATNAELKVADSTCAYRPISAYKAYRAVFYGLAKAAHDTTQAESSNSIGTYTDTAKQKIQNMLGITNLIATEESSTATAAHTVGSVFLMNGKLYKATSDITIGDAVASGTNCTPVNISEVYAAIDNPIFNNSISLGRKADTTIGTNSVAIGSNVEASGYGSFATGNSTVASGTQSKAEGYGAIASGSNSHAEGNGTIANGSNAHAEGKYNVEQTIFPDWVANTHYNIGDKVYHLPTTYECIEENTDVTWTSTHWKMYSFTSEVALVIGNGITNNDRSNALTLNWNGDLHLDGDVYVNANANGTGGTRLPYDIQINGNSIVSNGVATIPYADTTNSGGIVRANNSFGIAYAGSGLLSIDCADATTIKAGSNAFHPIVPYFQHNSVFYGLAKAAGDTTMASSSNTIGTYTDEAKSAIQTMLGVEPGTTLVETVSGTTPSITALPNVRYNCGEVSTISITPPANGTCDVFFTSGSTAAVLTVPNTVKWPAWFDATTLEADMIYEIMITDGVYGSVMTWES